MLWLEKVESLVLLNLTGKQQRRFANWNSSVSRLKSANTRQKNISPNAHGWIFWGKEWGVSDAEQQVTSGGIQQKDVYELPKFYDWMNCRAILRPKEKLSDMPLSSG